MKFFRPEGPRKLRFGQMSRFDSHLEDLLPRSPCAFGVQDDPCFMSIISYPCKRLSNHQRQAQWRVIADDEEDRAVPTERQNLLYQPRIIRPVPRNEYHPQDPKRPAEEWDPGDLLLDKVPAFPQSLRSGSKGLDEVVVSVGEVVLLSVLSAVERDTGSQQCRIDARKEETVEGGVKMLIAR